MEDTICAISSNLGNTGAISIIRLSGPESFQITNEIFSNKKFLNADTHTIHYGFIKEKDEVLDEVLVLKMIGPKTYTKEDVVEINCHGGSLSTKKILELLILHGARLAEPGEFTKRAFLNGRINLVEAESVGDFINAESEKALSLAMNGITGKISKMIEELRVEIVEILTNIGVNIDFPEYDDVTVITNDIIKPKIEDISKKLLKMIEESENGQLIKNGINIAFIGRPNVGKSSLLNAFLEEEKAIVTDISGTTRDIIESSIQLNGIELNLIDTAGIRETEDIVEKIGVQKSKKALENADLIILVLNSNESLTKEDYELLKLIQNKKYILFLNKNDLETNIELNELNKDNIVFGNTIYTNGLDELKNKITDMFHLNEIENKDMNYLSNVRQITLAKKAFQNIEEVRKLLKENTPIDLLELDLKEAWNNLGLITGAAYEEELLDEMFKRFCLGK